MIKKYDFDQMLFDKKQKVEIKDNSSFENF